MADEGVKEMHHADSLCLKDVNVFLVCHIFTEFYEIPGTKGKKWTSQEATNSEWGK